MTTGLFSPWHIAILVLVVLLLFGPKKLPEIGRSLGGGMREFKDSITGAHGGETPQLPAETHSPAEQQQTVAAGRAIDNDRL
jgi:sec-independent protein translocase protein TatA